MHKAFQFVKGLQQFSWKLNKKNYVEIFKNKISTIKSLLIENIKSNIEIMTFLRLILICP